MIEQLEKQKSPLSARQRLQGAQVVKRNLKNLSKNKRTFNGNLRHIKEIIREIEGTLPLWIH